MIAMVAIGVIASISRTDRLFPGHYTHFVQDGDRVTAVVRMRDSPVERNASYKAEAEILELMNDEMSRSASGRVLLYFQKHPVASAIQRGDIIAFTGRLAAISPPQNPDEFNYKRYMGFHQIEHQVYLREDEWCIVSTGDGLWAAIGDWQQQIIGLLRQSGLHADEFAVVSALLVGYKHHLSARQVQAFASAGAMHVLAVSGLHVGIVFLIISMLLRPLKGDEKWKLWSRSTILLISLWLYAALTGLSPSVTRAATMFSFVIIAQLINRNTSIYNTIVVSAIFLLLINPYLIVEVGFQLSYLAVLGIVLLQPRIYELWHPENWIADKLWAITAVSISAQVATFPLGLLYFHQFPNYFLLSNFVVIPAAMLIIPVGMAYLLFSGFDLFASLLATALGFLLKYLNAFIVWVESLPGALVTGIDITVIETYIIYLLVVSVVAFLITERFQWLRLFLIGVIGIELLNISEVWRQQGLRELVFYSIGNHVAIDFVGDQKHVLIADSSLLDKPDKMRFHIEHHWWKIDSKPTDTIVFSYEKPLAVDWYGKRILIMGRNLPARSVGTAPVDLLYITSRTATHPKAVIETLCPQMVIISRNVDFKSRNYWVKVIEEAELMCHDISASGAYVSSDFVQPKRLIEAWPFFRLF
ncbi:MAG: ComEC/Rec2 family competence protein [Salibacteraceae bacterium]